MNSKLQNSSELDTRLRQLLCGDLTPDLDKVAALRVAVGSQDGMGDDELYAVPIRYLRGALGHIASLTALSSETAELAIARLEHLERALTEACEALEPFADALCDDDEDEADHVQGTLVIGRSTIYSLDLGDFRRARRALTQSGNE
jgi:hypothetical protein